MTIYFKMREDGITVPCDDPIEWADHMRQLDRSIGDVTIGLYRVSTVFLGLNHRFSKGDPVLFETMIFEKDSFDEKYCRRYCTRAEALDGHNQTVASIEAGKVPD